MTHRWANALDTVSWLIVLPALACAGYRIFERSDDRKSLVCKWIASAALVLVMLFVLWIRLPHLPLKPLFILFPALIIGRIWAPSVGEILGGCITHAIDGGTEEVAPKPFYFMAEGKRRKGLYAEAIAEARKQLGKFPGDFEGHEKIASIQMENLHDLAAARATLEEFVDLPNRAPNEKVSALYLLADWQLQFGRDAQAAELSLQRIVSLYPGTPFAHAAQQRIAHLASFEETSRVRHESKFIVGAADKNAPVAAPVDPHDRAAELVNQLELHPSDTQAREELAVLYAAEFHRLDLAADQLEQLIALPAEPPKHVARWLNLLATLHIKHAQDPEAAARVLKRIMERFPGSAAAEVTVTRLASLRSELKASQVTGTKTIGVYGKNIGLNPSSG